MTVCGYERLDSKVIGWYRATQRARWHLMKVWEANEFFLIPACGRESPSIFRHKRTIALKTREQLPKFALLCQGCAASKEAAA